MDKIEEFIKYNLRIRKIMIDDYNWIYQIYTKSSWYYLCSDYEIFQLSHTIYLINDVNLIEGHRFISNYDVNAVSFALEHNTDKIYITNSDLIELKEFTNLKDYINEKFKGTR